MTDTYLVIGATGLQGGAVAAELLRRGAKVRALTRKTSSPKARALADRGVTVVAGDLTDLATLPAAFEGVAGVFSVQDFYAPGVGLAGELAQGRAVMSAAKAAGVAHIVQSTMGDGHRPGGPEHFLAKAMLERDLQRSGLAWTHLGTVWFMDNLLNPAMQPKLLFPVLTGSLEPSTVFPMLATDDLGWVAAEALTKPNYWAKRKINLAGDAMTVAQMKKIYRKATNRKPKGWSIPAAVFRRLAPEFAAQLAWHNEVNFCFGPEELRAIKPDATSFQDYLRRIVPPHM